MQTTKETVEPVANSAIDSAFTTLGYAPPEPPQNKKQEKSDLPLPNNQESEAGFKAKQALAFLTKNADEKGGQKTWDAWMEVARGYAYGRDYAKNVAGGKTNGKIYANAMGWFLTKYDLGDDHLHKSTRSRLLSCYEHRDEIEEWRKNQDGRVLNNPVLVWQA